MSLFRRFWPVVAAGALPIAAAGDLPVFCGIYPIATAESSRAFRWICPVEVIRLCSICPITAIGPSKTKIPPFLQLFCDYGLFSVPLTRKLAAAQPIICAFIPRFAIGGVHHNPQSQKSCNPSRFSVFSLSANGSRVCASLVQLVNVCRAHLALC